MLFRNRNFFLLWLVNLTTTFAIELFTISILVTIFAQTESTLQAAGTMVVRMLPAFLLGPVAGTFADRFSRKNLLIWMDVFRLLLVGGAAFLLIGETGIPVLGGYLIILGLSAADVLHRPARLALIPNFVSAQELVNANSTILVSGQIIVAGAYLAGGWLIQLVPINQISFSVIIIFGVAILCSLLMVIPKREKTEKELKEDEESLWRSFVSGWNYLVAHPIAQPLTVMETIEHVPHGIWTGAIMLAFTTQVLGGTVVEWGYIVTTYFTGMIIGSFLSLWFNEWLGRYPGWIIIVNALLSGVLTFVFGLSSTVLFAAILGMIFGPPTAIRDVAQDALLQGTVEEGQLGRVYATREMLRSTVFMVSGLGFAWLSDKIPVNQIYLIGGVIYLLTGFYALSNKPLRESRMDAIAQPVTQTQGDS